MIEFDIKSKVQPIGTRKGQIESAADRHAQGADGVFRPAQDTTVFHEQDAHRAHRARDLAVRRRC